MRRTSIVYLLVLFLLPLPLLAQSQATTGVIEGTVTDATGAVLPGVTVSLKDTATNFEKMEVTRPQGMYRGVLLPLGPYEIKATLEGFAPQVVRGVDLGLGQTLTVNIKVQQTTEKG